MELTAEQAPGLSMDIKGKEFAPVLSVTKEGTAGPGGPYSDTGGRAKGLGVSFSFLVCTTYRREALKSLQLPMVV